MFAWELDSDFYSTYDMMYHISDISHLHTIRDRSTTDFFSNFSNNNLKDLIDLMI